MGGLKTKRCHVSRVKQMVVILVRSSSRSSCESGQAEGIHMGRAKQKKGYEPGHAKGGHMDPVQLNEFI